MALRCVFEVFWIEFLSFYQERGVYPVWALYNIKEELGHLSCARTQRPA